MIKIVWYLGDDDVVGGRANSDVSLPKWGKNSQPMFYGLIFLSRVTYILLSTLLRQLSNSFACYMPDLFPASFSYLVYCLLHIVLK